MFRSFRVAAALLLLSGTVHAADNPFNVDPALDKKIQDGLHELYNLDFDKAVATFESLRDQAPAHPMIAFGLTSTHWWRLSVYVLESDPEESKAFLTSVDECMKLSQEMIKRGDKTGEGYLTLGGAEGLLGRWQAANRQWMPAYFKGKSAYRNLRRALKTNPKMMDAYMGLGIFDYYVATLPAFVRMLAFLGSGGDPSKGLKELHKAADHGTYARTPSLLFLVNIYSSLENKPEEAIPLLDRLRGEFPKSPFIHILRVVALYAHGSDDDLADVVKEFGDRVKDGTYREEFRTQAHFAEGVMAFRARKWDEAAKHFEMGIAAGTVKDPFFTWSHLYRGYSLDALGLRDDAVKEYQDVMAQIRRWGSHDNAEARLKKPFKGEDEIELKKLVL